MGGQFYLIKLLFKLSYSYEPNCDLLCLWWWGCAGYVVEVAQDMQRRPLGTHYVKGTHAYTFPRKYALQFALQFKVRKANALDGWI